MDHVQPSPMAVKTKYTVNVTLPNNPSIYTGNNNSLKAAYKQKLKLYEEYEEHKRNTIKSIQACFNEDLLIDLESDGMLLGVTPMEDRNEKKGMIPNPKTRTTIL